MHLRIENEQLDTGDNKIAKIFNEYFANIIKSLDICSDTSIMLPDHFPDSILINIEICKDHPIAF